ncbi:IS256 family transposase [Mycoplasmopsis felis]|uniref:IS256 family transposase n=1 Tax=Mycoplasmopsis felis TaxID=33923 RepID=UPI002AF6B27A|nr:IS256 family transposase [Mycoplasmopsis felis]WQQ02032.1 IS256 family transposase [Mycoplasmopsis felis]
MQKKNTFNLDTEKLYNQYKPKTIEDVQEILKSQTKDLIEKILQEEMKNYLGYDRYEHEKAIKDNYRNGSYDKKVRSQFGDINLKIPRDRNAEFEPQVVPKFQYDISFIEGAVIKLYSSGMSTRDISSTLHEIYGIDVETSFVSRITDKIMPQIIEWRNRPLEKEYAMVFIDGIRFKVKEENRLVEKSVYIVMGYTLEGKKDVLGFWIGESESAKYWMQVLNDLKLRGVQEIFIISSDNLTGISNAIKAVFPKTQIQKCVVHQIRNSVKFVNYKDLKEFAKDMKNIYQANNIDEATRFLQIFEDKWKDKYMYAIKSWRDNFEELVTFFNFPKEIRKLIYTTNIIENLNRNIRKITKTKTSFPTEESLMKSVYFAINNQLAKWDKITPNWGQILSQLLIIFKENN